MKNIDFESITLEDKKDVLNNIENINQLSFIEIKEKIKNDCIKILATSNNEKTIYLYLLFAIEYNFIDELEYKEITETTLKILIKDININHLFSLNSTYHTIKIESFEKYLNSNIENPKINMINKWLNLNNQIIHIDNVIKLQKIYKFKYIDAIVIVDDVSKIFKLNKFSEDDFIFSGTSTLYCFCKSKNECDYLDFLMSKSEENTKFRFFINTIFTEKVGFKIKQQFAFKIYSMILNNPNVKYKNIWNKKLNSYNPLYCSNIKHRNIIFNELEM